DPLGLAGAPYGDREAREVVGHEGDVGGVEGDIGSGGAHGDSNVRGGEGGGVVDPVADEEDAGVAPTELVHGGDCLCGEQPGTGLVASDAGAAAGVGNCVRRRPVVPGEHDDALDPGGVQRAERRSGGGADAVGDGDHAVEAGSG